ncbi:hypothetical protein EVAR_43830_1 [Eumeta japonica]|uniref:Secreted protein n=1 Tax=Eumeta variegata TaxID=151549 RepID=A0A4C1WX85_EUMVA|nr:hypothetical protein EVAR_43830_1 [Eumeta japonica]
MRLFSALITLVVQKCTLSHYDSHSHTRNIEPLVLNGAPRASTARRPPPLDALSSGAPCLPVVVFNANTPRPSSRRCYLSAQTEPTLGLQRMSTCQYPA